VDSSAHAAGASSRAFQVTLEGLARALDGAAPSLTCLNLAGTRLGSGPGQVGPPPPAPAPGLAPAPAAADGAAGGGLGSDAALRRLFGRLSSLTLGDTTSLSFITDRVVVSPLH
jgi:hypothetical protein